MSLLYFPLPKSFLSFQLSSPSGPLCPLQPFPLFCHLRVLLSFLLFFLSLCTIFSSKSLSHFSFHVVCVRIWEGWLTHGVTVRERGLNTQENAECHRKSKLFEIFYFNVEHQQMQKLKSNTHKIWSLCISHPMPFYPPGVLQDQLEAQSFKRSLTILFLLFISQKVLNNFFSRVY